MTAETRASDRTPPAPQAPADAPSPLRPHVTIRGLSKRFDKAVIYDNFDLDIPRGKLISVFGPNGCGKSTLINMIAGLIPPDDGQILFDGMPLSEIKFGYVFQNYREALFPWMRAFDNIDYPLKLMKVPKPERRARVEQLVAHLGVKLDLKRYPYEMSGGQQQLISIMRALVVEPEILFLDEPFSALDYEMTLFMREQLQRIFIETGTTTVLVSHDLEEAVYLADRVLLLSRASGAGRRFRAVRRRPAAIDATRCRSRISSASRRTASMCSSARCGAHEDGLDPFLPIVGVVGLIALWYFAVWNKVVDPVLLPSPTDAFQRLVEGHERRQARLRFPPDRASAPSCRSRSRR